MREANLVSKRIISSILALVMIISIFSVSGITADAKKKKQADMSAYTTVFDPTFYATKYPDLKAAFGNDANALFNHFLTNGMKEGRQGNAEFEVNAYRARYADLNAAFGNDLPKYYMHYITNGKAEGRSGKPAAVTTTTTATTTQAPANNPYSAENLYNIMVSFKGSYPEGMRYTNDDFYRWNGGIYYGGYGCAGFAFMLSDACFGNTKATMLYDVNAIRVGDVVRINNDTHSVIILKIENGVYTFAEANYNSSVHWGRQMTYERLASCFTNVMTRYPQ